MRLIELEEEQTLFNYYSSAEGGGNTEHSVNNGYGNRKVGEWGVRWTKQDTGTYRQTLPSQCCKMRRRQQRKIGRQTSE